MKKIHKSKLANGYRLKANRLASVSPDIKKHVEHHHSSDLTLLVVLTHTQTKKKYTCIEFLDSLPLASQDFINQCVKDPTNPQGVLDCDIVSEYHSTKMTSSTLCIP